MIAQTIDPLQDPRWGKFLEGHPRASVFHSAAWLEALQRTYGYQPVVFTTSPPDQDLRDGLVFCRVDSWLTGRRLVSLPFSDHCESLQGDRASGNALLKFICEYSRQRNLRYIEFRPLGDLDCVPGPVQVVQTYYLHRLSLEPDIDILYRNLHKDSTQRKIRRAERERLAYEEGTSQDLLDSFYDLLRLTRRRHGMPPQPRAWFENLIRCFPGSLKIRVALHGKQPIAAIITVRHKDTLVYKYGCSDVTFHNLGGMQLLFWKTITEAKSEGLQDIDLGRSQVDNHGLIQFKDRLGATRSTLTYSRYYLASRYSWRIQVSDRDWKVRFGQAVFANIPNRCLSVVGKLLYKHMG